jgi:hypothetical protein
MRLVYIFIILCLFANPATAIEDSPENDIADIKKCSITITNTHKDKNLKISQEPRATFIASQSPKSINSTFAPAHSVQHIEITLTF